MPFPELEEWLRSHGATLSGVEAREMSSGDRGLFATRSLAPGEVIIRLPPSVLISGHSARAATHVANVLDAVHEDKLEEGLEELANCDKDTVAIVLFLIAEAAKGTGLFQPWIDSLPKRFYTPITAPRDVIDAKLSGSFVLTFALEVREELRTLYDKFILPYAVGKFPHAYPPEKTTFELFLWAYSVSETRAFELGSVNKASSAETNRGTLLTPYADMMNHSCDAKRVSAFVRKHRAESCSNNEQVGFEVYIAQNTVQPNEEILISYGQLDNARLLLHYGFAEQKNPHDHVKLTLAPPDDESADLITRKALLLELGHGSSLGTEHEIRVSDPLPINLLASLRLLSMTEEEAQNATIHTDFTASRSPRNEDAVFNFLSGVLNMLSRTSQGKMQLQATDVNGLAAFVNFCDIYMVSLQATVCAAWERLRILRSKGGVQSET
jgi:hypothetical protein